MIKKALSLACIHIVGICSIAFGNILTVTNTDDSGPGSLRQAIIDSNTNTISTFNNINFDIPGSCAHIITPDTDLPPITKWVIIDGYTQHGAEPANGLEAAEIKIEINGMNTSVAGLELAAGSDHSTIRGLAINNCTLTPAILIESDFSTIEGNFIGINAEGDKSLRNNSGIVIVSSNNQIGGDRPAKRNVIAGTDQLRADGQGNGAVVQPGSNILIAGDNNRVQGNYIGLNKHGTEVLGKSDIGILIRTGDHTLIGGEGHQGNVISGNTYVGVLVGFNRANPLPITNTTISANYIGTDHTGRKALGNGYGIGMWQDSSNTVIGGLNVSQANVISGNKVSGINVAAAWEGINLGGFGGANHPVAGPTYIQGNIIGLDRTGRKRLGNGFDGIELGQGTNHTFIGASGVTGRNIISANHRNGIFIHGFATQNYVTGNYVGTDVTGAKDLGNRGNGIQIGAMQSGASDNVIGGLNVEGNLISGNGEHGVSIEAHSFNNQVIGNIIGTNADVSAKLGNERNGIFVGFRAKGTTIGGPLGQGNIICANEHNGIKLKCHANDAIIQGNTIGKKGLANAGAGIVIDGSINTLVGGSAADSNRIRHNSGYGVVVKNAKCGKSHHNEIEHNSIDDNGCDNIHVDGKPSHKCFK